MNRLKKIRTALNLTQSDFAKGISISRSQVASIESGARNLTERLQKDLVINFGVNPDWFNNEEEEMFLDKYRELDLSPEEREFTDLYESLDQDSKSLILTMMKKISSN